jgi:hypothetical protein
MNASATGMVQSINETEMTMNILMANAVDGAVDWMQVVNMSSSVIALSVQRDEGRRVWYRS